MSCKKPKISVIMPVFNCENHIKRSVMSILRQTQKNFELIIINDGSTDRTLQIIRCFADKYKCIRIFNLPKCGIVKCLNFGLEKALGKYIARMDSDDVCIKKRLEYQKNFLDNNPQYGIVSSKIKYSGNKNKNMGYYLYVKWLNSLLTHNKIINSAFIESPIAHPSVMFRKELINKYGKYKQGNFPEDYELWLRFIENNVKFFKLNINLYVWKDHSKRLSRTNIRYSNINFKKCKLLYLISWINKNVNKELDLVVWGVGKKAKFIIKELINNNINISYLIDVDSKKIGKTYLGLDIKNYELINSPLTIFILYLVSNRFMREKGAIYLKKRGFVEGKHFIFAG